MKTLVRMGLFCLLCGGTLWADQGAEFKQPIKPWDASTDGPLLPITNPGAVVQTFRQSYQALGKPRTLIYINRRLVRDRGEMVVTAETSHSIKTKGDPVTVGGGGNVQIGSANKVEEGSKGVSGKGGERLESTQRSERTVDSGLNGVRAINEMEAREIEESFQQPLMDAGVILVDQRVAQISNKSFSSVDGSFLTAISESREKEEVESLKKSADWVIEIMTEMRPVKILMASGNDRTEERPKYVVTLMRLKDGAKLAQVNSDSLFGFNKRKGEQKQRQMRQVTGSEIAEQTALALMQRVNP
jgi:hypothetical protein